MSIITPFYTDRLASDHPPKLGDLAAHVFFDDFDRFVAADWTITTTEGGSGSATEALTNAEGGVLLVTNDNADNDLDFFNKVGESFKMATGKRAWFGARFKVSNATESDFVFGLQITDTTILAVTDGIYFQKNDDDALLDFHVTKDSVSSSSTGLVTVANDTWIVVGWHFDGASRVIPYVNGVEYPAVAVTNLPDDEELTVAFGLQNGSAVAHTLSVDYLYAAQER